MVEARKLVIGLIGGIGSGKSTVAEAFARRGARLIVADQLGHEALRQPAIRDKLVARWGPRILDETDAVSRKAVASIVFAATAEARDELRALEDAVFPWIERRAPGGDRPGQGDAQVRLIVLDAAIMMEAGRIVCVTGSCMSMPRGRCGWSGWPGGAAGRRRRWPGREAAQCSLTEKATRADAAVDNAGTPDEVQRQVDALLADWGLATDVSE